MSVFDQMPIKGRRNMRSTIDHYSIMQLVRLYSILGSGDLGGSRMDVLHLESLE